MSDTAVIGKKCFDKLLIEKVGGKIVDIQIHKQQVCVCSYELFPNCTGKKRKKVPGHPSLFQLQYDICSVVYFKVGDVKCKQCQNILLKIEVEKIK